MKGKRTGIDWSKHELKINNESDNFASYALKIPGSSYHCCYFINTHGICSVTGDLGNWIFCREFHPDIKDIRVSDGYWKEKLSISSCQEPAKYDSERTREELLEALKNEDLTEEYREYYEECLKSVDNELEYSYQAFRNIPNRFDYEDAIFCKSVSIQLLAVFDAFEEISRRVKETEENKLCQ